MDNGASVEFLWSDFRTDGTLSSFRRLFDSFYAPLCRYACLIVKDRMDAEEIVLDLFIYLWKNREKVNINSSLESYLFRSVKNRAFNFLRSKQGDKVRLDDLESRLAAPSLLSSVEMEDISEIIQKAVSSLPPKCREVFNKSRESGLTNEEIASEMGITVKTVEAHMTRALKTLRVQLKKMYIFFIFL